MAITGQTNINIGQQNQASGSDSLYSAFTKTQDNFTRLFNAASPFSTFIANSGTPGQDAGISVNANANTSTVSFRNTGVTSITGGTGVAVSSANGDVTISMTGTGVVGVTSVGVRSPNNSIAVSNVTGNIVSSGVFNIDLAEVPNVVGTYFNPRMTIDNRGRVTAIASQATLPNTVSNVTITGTNGVSVTPSGTNSNPIFTIRNTGITNIVAGAGISASVDTNGVAVITASQGGGINGSVTNVTVRAASNNIAVGSNANNVSPGNSYSSATNATFFIDIANALSVSTVTANAVTSNSVIVAGNLSVTGTSSTINSLTVQQALFTTTIAIPESPPSTNASPGIKGTITFDSNFMYVCTAANTWARAALVSAW